MTIANEIIKGIKMSNRIKKQKKILCENCNKKSNEKEWREISLSCGIWNIYDGMECPLCKHMQDEK